MITNVTAISAGRFHTCALINDEIVKCWGRDGHGRLGTGRLILSSGPLDVRTIPTTDIPGIDTLASDCTYMLPPGDPVPIVCVVGMIYVDGQPQASIPIQIGHRGRKASETQSLIYPGSELRPHYQAMLALEPGEPITIEAEWNDIKYQIDAVTKPGVQQLDIVIPSTQYDNPIGTIQHLSHITLSAGEILTAQGIGQTNDTNHEIVTYRWTSDRQGELTDTSTLSVPARNLEPGTHQLAFQVQDSQGVWSAPVNTTIYVARPPATTWTMLLYLAGDYHDRSRQYRAFRQTVKSLQNERLSNVNIAVQLDGPTNDDTTRWLIAPGQTQQEIKIDEQAMDTADSLANFLRWGQSNLPAQH